MKGVWETFRGNPWDNRGVDKLGLVGKADGGDSGSSSSAEAEASSKGSNVIVEAKLIARKVFYEQRAKCEFLA